MPPRRVIDEALTEVTRPFLLYLTRLHAELGGRTEIRILRDGVVWSGLIGPREVDATVAALRPVADKPRGATPRADHPRSGEANIYFSLGAVRPDSDLQMGPPFRRAARTAKDADIVGSPWVVVDVDPDREPKGRSSTDAEKASALGVAEAIRETFAARGVPTVLADSGNGWHLLAKTVAATGDAVRGHAEGCKRLLHALDARFSTPGAKVDKAVHNPGRIFKLYGTVAVKGGDIAEAPHRLSSIDPDAIPAEVDVLALLADLTAAPKETSSKSAPTGSASSASADAPEWRAWKAEALARLDLSAVYGDLLTGRRRDGWLECREPSSSSGDQHPSAGVADGGGQAPPGSFHSFISGETISVFDFLVKQGRAADYMAACRWVAEQTGVQLPPRRAPEPEVTLETFAERWGAAADDLGRARVLAAAIKLTLGLPAVAQAPAQKALREASGLTPAVFRAAVSEARKAHRTEHEESDAGNPLPPPSGLPVVQYITNEDTVEALSEKILAVILPLRRFFRFEHGAVYVHKGRGPIVLDERNLPGILSAYLELGMYQRGEKDKLSFSAYEPLPLNLARALVNNPRFRSKLPELVAYVRSPVFDLKWNFIATFGWHEPSGIFYDGPAVVPLSTNTSTCKALGGFHWKDTPDVVNCIGVLLTMLTIPMWSSGHPFVPINGNQAGVGKSTLARLIAAIVEGRVPPTVTFTPNDEEFEKQIATRIEAGDRVIIVDNAKARGPISSAVLERCITDARISFRRLGSNSAISRPQNDVLFVLTMNLTQLGADLRRRALALNLQIEGNVRNQAYAVDDPVGDALAARTEILGELAGLVLAWVEAGRPMPEDPARHSVSQGWARTIDAILRHAELTGFLSNFEESERAFDADFEVMLEIAATLGDRGFMPATDWSDHLLNKNILSDRLLDHRGRPRSPQSMRTTVGSIFARYLDQKLKTPEGTFALRQHIPRKGHPPLYGFECLELPEGVAEDGDITSTDPGSTP